MKYSIAAALVLAFIALLVGSDGPSPSGTSVELVAARRAAEPPDRPTGFNGAPVIWIEAGDRSVWMDAAGSCWSRPAGDGGFVGGCADTIGPSCEPRGTIPATPTFAMRPGEQVWIHVVGADVALSGASYEPRDIAADRVDVESAADGADTWVLRAPDADALLSVGVQGSAKGDSAGFAMCIDVSGDAPADAQPVVVTSTRSLIRSRATAELRFGIDADRGGPIAVVAGSLRCAHVRRTAVSASLVWRCSALIARPGARRGTREVATLATWQRGLTEWSSAAATILDSNAAHRASRRGITAISGYLMEQPSGSFRLCAAGYVSMPPSCNRGGVRVIRVDATAYRLDSYGSRRFSRDPITVFGRLADGVLTADP